MLVCNSNWTALPCFSRRQRRGVTEMKLLLPSLRRVLTLASVNHHVSFPLQVFIFAVIMLVITSDTQCPTQRKFTQLKLTLPTRKRSQRAAGVRFAIFARMINAYVWVSTKRYSPSQVMRIRLMRLTTARTGMCTPRGVLKKADSIVECDTNLVWNATSFAKRVDQRSSS